MLLLVGLGNPGAKYAGNRHNVGFMAVDAIARAYNFGPWKKKFQGELAEGQIDGVRTLLLKPQTYMNESGRAVGEAANFHKLSAHDVVAFYDEIDLAPGRFRMKTGGGAAGHNGIRSIIASSVGEGFRRARLGVGHPGQKELVHHYVLSDFYKAEVEWLNALLDACAKAAPMLAKGDDEKYQGEVMRLAPAAKADPRKPGAGETA
ncbi:aminoacyl-tRNA hydrolase [Candidatus Viadribacter manganicus]|uniref:Peptidyl-tRNA hydrolase n=1 Tax=Candidatus Viadribacter manganicus TaxID=1759059 RepID=A0A1B1AKN4_9PROT|nr:aminoacyl-tRNA hydrolase [Candidatus Viadribacter manganicus]ANP47117.1 peptidyl-tRNA hydrolase [Candidatus Viadribacter manganicus]